MAPCRHRLLLHAVRRAAIKPNLKETSHEAGGHKVNLREAFREAKGYASVLRTLDHFARHLGNLKDYSLALSALARVGAWRQAIHVVSDMPKQSIKPNKEPLVMHEGINIEPQIKLRA